MNLHETAALFYCLGLFIIGAQFLSVGLLGEMIAAHWVRDTDTYSIAEHTSPVAGTKERRCRERETARHPAIRIDMSDDTEQIGRQPVTRTTSAPGSRAPCSLLNVRWGVYLLLIAIAVGNMTGRLLSVNSVDKIVQLEAARIKDQLAAERQQLIEEGVAGEQLESRMAVEEARLQRRAATAAAVPERQ